MASIVEREGVGRDRLVPEKDAASVDVVMKAASPDGPAAVVVGAGSPVFDVSVLHEISLQVDPPYLTMLENDRIKRVPATFSFDGQTIAKVGIRKKGSYGSYAKLTEKAAFTVKFDEFVPGTKFMGVEKIALNNCRQDPTLVAEHTGYELYRRANLPAPLTAHAVVTFNGVVKGIFVVAEATDKTFLKRIFGKDNGGGNLYEGGYLGDLEFVLRPEKLDLKGEIEDMRSRADVTALAETIRTAPAEKWVDAVGARMDLPAFTTSYAIDGLINHWDSYSYNTNNYYLYHRPTDDRFVLIPHGMDSLFQVDVVFGPRNLLDVLWTKPPPDGSCRACGLAGDLPRRLRAIPALDAAYRAEIQRVLREVWDLPAINARIDRVAALLRGSKRTDPAFVADLNKFEQYIPAVRKFLSDRKTALFKP